MKLKFCYSKIRDYSLRRNACVLGGVISDRKWVIFSLLFPRWYEVRPALMT